MLTEEEQAFLAYWEQKRRERPNLFQRFLKGIGYGITFSLPIILFFLFAWSKVLQITRQELITILIGIGLIASVVALIKTQFDWERKEERYWYLKNRQEGMAKEKDTEAGPS